MRIVLILGLFLWGFILLSQPVKEGAYFYNIPPNCWQDRGEYMNFGEGKLTDGKISFWPKENTVIWSLNENMKEKIKDKKSIEIYFVLKEALPIEKVVLYTRFADSNYLFPHTILYGEKDKKWIKLGEIKRIEYKERRSYTLPINVQSEEKFKKLKLSLKPAPEDFQDLPYTVKSISLMEVVIYRKP